MDTTYEFPSRLKLFSPINHKFVWNFLHPGGLHVWCLIKINYGSLVGKKLVAKHLVRCVQHGVTCGIIMACYYPRIFLRKLQLFQQRAYTPSQAFILSSKEILQKFKRNQSLSKNLWNSKIEKRTEFPMFCRGGNSWINWAETFIKAPSFE